MRARRHVVAQQVLRATASVEDEVARLRAEIKELKLKIIDMEVRAANARDFLRKAIGFSFPYGEHGPITVDHVREELWAVRTGNHAWIEDERNWRFAPLASMSPQDALMPFRLAWDTAERMIAERDGKSERKAPAHERTGGQ